LRSDVQLWTPRNIPAVFLGNQSGESVRHKPMLADVHNRKQGFTATRFHWVQVNSHEDTWPTRQINPFCFP
jgi:hypothetical protein